jgi:hypothetical protein
MNHTFNKVHHRQPPVRVHKGTCVHMRPCKGAHGFTCLNPTWAHKFKNKFPFKLNTSII